LNEKGFTLLEALIAMAILAIVLAGLVTNFQAFLDANSASEEMSNALAAAQQVIEEMRHVEPSTLPESGTSAVEVVQVGDHEYEVVTHYCLVADYCSAASRHIVIEVGFAGRTVYTIETVFSRLS
jgi:prepilin-type N-terminal cleavage/methylation domain-containing protein